MRRAIILAAWSLAIATGAKAETISNKALSTLTYKMKGGWNAKTDEVEQKISLSSFLKNESAGQPDGVFLISCSTPRYGRSLITFRLALPRSSIEPKLQKPTIFEMSFGGEGNKQQLGGQVAITDSNSLFTSDGVAETVDADDTMKFGVNSFKDVQEVFKRLAATKDFRIRMNTADRNYEIAVSRDLSDPQADKDDKRIKIVAAHCINYFP